MASVQDLESRVGQLERMVEFTMRMIQTMRPSPLVDAPPTRLTLLDMYIEASRAGLTIAEATKEEENA